MRRSQSPSVISMEKLMEVDIVPKVWIPIKFLVPTVRRATAIHVTPKDMDQTVLDLLRDVSKVHVVAAASRALDLEVAAVVLVEALEGLDKQEIDGELIEK